MSLTYSQMLPLGTIMPNFSLINVMNNKTYSNKDLLSDQITIIMIICNHCPYVIHYHGEIKLLVSKYLKMGVKFIAISSNDVNNYPQDSPDKMKELFNDLSLSIPYLYDESQEVAKSFKAECTPEFYLFGKSKRLVYRGRLDSSSPGNGEKINGEDFRTALDLCIDGKEINSTQYPSMGCNIKWK